MGFLGVKGDLAFFDSLRGMIPVKVTGVTPTDVQFTVTAARPGYPKGYKDSAAHRNVPPRKAVSRQHIREFKWIQIPQGYEKAARVVHGKWGSGVEVGGKGGSHGIVRLWPSSWRATAHYDTLYKMTTNARTLRDAINEVFLWNMQVQVLRGSKALAQRVASEMPDAARVAADVAMQEGYQSGVFTSFPKGKWEATARKLQKALVSAHDSAFHVKTAKADYPRIQYYQGNLEWSSEEVVWNDLMRVDGIAYLAKEMKAPRAAFGVGERYTMYRFTPPWSV